MKLTEFLEYLHSRMTTSELATGLVEVLVLRGRPDLVPVAVKASTPRRVAS